MPTKIFIKTYGCALNRSDSELMSGLLKDAGFELVDNLEDAFVVIVNTCTVKGPAESKFYKFIKEVKEQDEYKKIIITGCIAQTEKELKGYPMLGTSQLTNIVSLVEETLHDNPIKMLKREKNQRLNLPKVRSNPVIEIIPVCESCLGAPCTYCKVKEARGDFRSYPKEEIIKQVRSAVSKGIPEIWLTAQDTGCYGKDIGSSLPELLNELVRIPGNFKIRLGMCNPNHANEFLLPLIEAFKSDKMFKFIHLPLQSGNNEVLKKMKRKYTAEEFQSIIRTFRKEIPSITIATDIICGFPGEEEMHFNDSIGVIRNISPDVLNISRYWKRPRTKAAKMDNQVEGKEIKRRSTIIASIFHNISRMQNEKWLNWQGEILIDEKGKDDSWVGRNLAYKPVIVFGDHKLGDRLNVKINKTTIFDLRAQ